MVGGGAEMGGMERREEEGRMGIRWQEEEEREEGGRGKRK